MCKLNSFSKEWFCTELRYKSESFLTWKWPTVNIIVLHLQELFPFCFLPSSMKTLPLNWLIPSTKREVYESFVMAAQVQFEVWMVKPYVLRSEKKIIKKWNNNKRNKHNNNNNNNNNNIYYYSFNQNIRFWLAEIPQIIHHNQPLLTKWKKCAIIMWKMTSILQQNCQKTGQLIEETWGWGLIVLVLRRHFTSFARKK